MVDAGDTGSADVEIHSIEALGEAHNTVNAIRDTAIEGQKRFISNLQKLGNLDTMQKLGAGWKDINKFIKSSEVSTRGYQAALSKLDFSKTLGSINESFNQLKKSGAGMANDLISQFDDFNQEANKSVSGLADVATASGAAIGAALNVGLAQQIAKFKLPGLPEFGKMEDRINEIHKLALRTGIAFEGGFNRGTGATSALNDVIVDVQANFLGTREKALEVANILGKGMGTKGAITGIIQLSEAQGKFTESLTTTEAAMAISMATGASNTDIADVMVTAYQNLGETVEGSAKMFGTIHSAAKESGIGFDKTMKSIIDGASALKLWGGTVESVSPVFNAFSKSLKDSGIGRQGLTPELFKSFTEGISKMNFETRALLGITAGGGAGAGGALGAGLEMEAALEEGPEGMKKVIDGITETLKKFGGGEVVTRKEALEDPALSQQFMLQRGILKDILHVDDANANKMIEMISATEKSGLNITDEAAKNFSEIVNAGKETANQTTSTLDKATKTQNAAIDRMAETVVGELKNQLRGTTFTQVMKGFQADLRQTIKTGRPTMAATRAVANRIDGGAGKAGGTKRQSPAAGIALPAVGPIEIQTEPIADKLKNLTKTPSDNIKLPAEIISEIQSDIIPTKEEDTNEFLPPPTPPPLLSVEPEKPMEEAIDNIPMEPKKPTKEAAPMDTPIDRAMEQYGKRRAAGKGEIAPPIEKMAANAIDQASAATTTAKAMAGQDIDQASIIAREEKMLGTAGSTGAIVPGTQLATAETGGRGLTVEPSEYEVKIKVTLDKDTIKLDTSMLEDFIKLRANA